MNAVTLQRVAHRLHGAGVPLLPKLVYWVTFLVFNSSLPPGCRIGKGSKCAYGGIGVIVHERAVVGERVIIGSNVTIGGSFGSDVPIIGDNVWIGSGAKIIGTVRVGSNVVIGVNAVVTRDVPDNTIVAGVPARVLRTIPVGTLDAVGGRIAKANDVCA